VCMLILKPAGARIPDGMLEKAKALNPNGYGCAFCNGRGMSLSKNGTPVSVDGLTELWHFRYALSGVEDEDSTQPLVSLGNLFAFAHVGVMKEWSAQDVHSDSYNFYHHMGDFLNRCTYNAYYKRFLDAYCNVTQNRMVLLESSGRYWIFGEQNGYWDGGCWLSGVIE